MGVVMYPEHSVDELRAMRRNAELLRDFGEARRCTLALAQRGAFDSDSTGPRLLKASRARRITPAEADEKAQQFATSLWIASRDRRAI